MTLIGERPPEFREYYVLFTNSDYLPRQWRLFTRKGFEHCSIYVGLGNNASLGICQNMRNVEITHFAHNVHAVAEALAYDPENTVVYVPRIVGRNARWRLGLLFPTCVAMCQRYTGLTFHAFTPYYYFKSLMRSGGFLVSAKGSSDNMGKMFGGAPKPDQTLMKKQLEEQKAAEKRSAEEKVMQEDLSRRQRAGKRSLLGETETLGVL